MFKHVKKTKSELATYGAGLLHEFAGAVTNTAVAASLRYEAEQNEALALQNIAAVGASNAIYITPQDIPLDQQAYIAKTSVNAHIQKAQALQVAAYTDEQVHISELHVKEHYRGRKVTAQVISTDPWPVDTCWRDARSGQYHVNEHGPKKVSGIIEDIDLRKNYIIIRPTKIAKAVNSTVQFHRVYIISPHTFQPMVTLTF
jgi:hypothetical protein